MGNLIQLFNKLKTLCKFPQYDDGVKWLLIPTKITLNYLKEWPEINQNNTILNILYVINYFFAVFGQCYALYDKELNFEYKIFVINILCVHMEGTLRRITLNLYQVKLSKILTKIYLEFWPSKIFDKKTHKELTKKSWYLFSYWISYTIPAFFCGLQMVIIPYANRTLPLRTTYPFAWQESPYYELLYFWQIFSNLEIAFSICCGDLLVLSLLHNCIAQFKLLKIYLRSNFEKAIRKNNQVKAMEVLILFIEHHNKLIRTCNEINSVFSSFILMQCLASIGSVCLSSFVVTVVPESTGIASTYLLGHVSQLFIYCYLANDLIIESTQLATTAFECGWHLSSKDIDLQKTLIMIMIRSQKPIRLFTGGFGYLSMNSFISLLKFSLSVYTLLNNIMIKQDVS